MASIKYKDPNTGELKKVVTTVQLPSGVVQEIEQNTEDVRELKAAITHLDTRVTDIENGSGYDDAEIRQEISGLSGRVGAIESEIVGISAIADAISEVVG